MPAIKTIKKADFLELSGRKTKVLNNIYKVETLFTTKFYKIIK